MGRPRLSWRKDPIILARLVRVEESHLRGRTNYAIADELTVDEATVRNDLKRIRILWNEKAADSIAEQKERSVRVYRQVQQAAWGEMDDVPAKSMAKPAYLHAIRQSEDSIVKVLGLEAPVKVAPTDPTGEKEYAGHADAVRAAELAFLAALGIKPAGLGVQGRDAGASDAGADPV